DQRQPETIGLPGPLAALNRLVVCPAHRGRGFASLLDQARLEAARAEGCLFAVVAAHGPRVHALQTLGFADPCHVVSNFLALDGSERAVKSAVLVLSFKPSGEGAISPSTSA